MNKKDISICLSTFSVLITLAISYAIDYWIYLQQRYTRQFGDGGRILLWETLGGLLLCLIWIILGWLILIKNYRYFAISIISIIVGLVAYILFPLEYSGSVFLAKSIDILFIFPTQPVYLQFSGIFITTLGFLSALTPQQKTAL